MTALKQKFDPGLVIGQGCRQLGIDLKPASIVKMVRHMKMVQDWGGAVNLTSLSDMRETVVYHFIDSLTVLKVLPGADRFHLLDIGTGAGFPGLVLKAALPTLRLSLLDKDPRKVVFLKYVARELGFSGISFLNMNLKVLVDHAPKDPFTAVVSRALSSEAGFLDSLAGLPTEPRYLIRMSGPADKNDALVLSNFLIEDSWEGILPFSDRFRRVTLYRRR